MKSYRHLYPKVCDWNNLYRAWRKARRGKRGCAPAATFEFDLEGNLCRLQRELKSKSYRPGAYSSFYIHEPKRRLISAAPFRDRVVHHALCNVIEPLFERRFIDGSYANRRNKGTHCALDRCQAFARRYRYALQCDVVQFFPSIDHRVLRATLGRVIADPEVMGLVDLIVASGEGALSDEYDVVWFPGDDLLSPIRPRGLPIGNLTSQFWANCYMDPFDQYVKRELRCKGYLRYVDDFALFADDKATLWAWREAVVEYLARLRLTIHPGAHPRPVTEGMPFLGFVVYPTHRRLKRRSVVRYRRRLRRVLRAYRAGEISRDRVRASILGWINHARYGDTWGLRRAVFSETVL
jgi:retron-type reverse transcriptase